MRTITIVKPQNNKKRCVSIGKKLKNIVRNMHNRQKKMQEKEKTEIQWQKY